ncbi:MAG: ABC transporter substrate-binding protein [Clostridiales bacterium]|nr:ABC transporter substrate-binding protein [Clostridiales bacterium]
MKKLIALLLAAMLLVPAFVMAEELPVLKIGVFEPASGDSGAGGKQETLGVQYANYVAPTVEVGGTTYKVELEIADNGSSPDKAPSAAQKLVSAGVSVVLGTYGSSVAIAGSPYFKEAGIPAIGLTCTNPQVTAGNSHYFRVCFLDPFQGPVLANFAFKELGATTVYCLGELGNDYDQGLIEYFRQGYEALGGTIVKEDFPAGTADFTSYLTNATMYNADVFFCPVSLAYSTQIIQQAQAQGLQIAILGGDTLDSNVVVNAAKGTNVKVICTTFYQEGANAEFDEGFKKWLNENPDMLTNNGGNDMIAAMSVMGYDGYFMALEALKNAGSIVGADVMAALPATEIDGVSGHIKFDENGDAIRTAAFVKSVNNESGVWEFVAEQTVE